MRKKNIAELEKWWMTRLPFWNGELEYLLEKRYEHKYFRQFFLHICNYMTAEQILDLFKKDDMLRILMFDNYGDIFNVREKNLITFFTYEMANAIMRDMGFEDDILLKPGEFDHDNVPDILERVYLDWKLWGKTHTIGIRNL